MWDGHDDADDINEIRIGWYSTMAIIGLALAVVCLAIGTLIWWVLA